MAVMRIRERGVSVNLRGGGQLIRVCISQVAEHPSITGQRLDTWELEPSFLPVRSALRPIAGMKPIRQGAKTPRDGRQGNSLRCRRPFRLGG